MHTMAALPRVMWDMHWQRLELHLQFGVLMGLASAVELGGPTQTLLPLLTFLGRL